MRRVLAALALAVLVSTAGCSALAGTSGTSPGGQAPQPQQAGNATTTDDGRTVAVAATGTVRTAPDRAVVRVAVTARADSVAEVRRRLAENASEMRDALEGMGLESDQVTSGRYDIGRNYEHEDRPSVPAFEGYHEFVVTVTDPDRAGEAVVTAVENGATRVEGVQFTIAPETRRELREEALAAAVENARGKATVAAEGTGLTLDGVDRVQTAEVSTTPIRREEVSFAASADTGGGAPTSIAGGEVSVRAQVTVVYDATDG
jgi:hypothetical protein